MISNETRLRGKIVLKKKEVEMIKGSEILF